MRFVFFLLLLLGLSTARGADRVAEIVRIHTEAVGGKDRIAALTALRATGVAFAGGKQVKFTMTAARPAKLLLETENGARSLVQGTDGSEAPWEFDTGTWPPKYRAMADTAARTFMADAEFDDPLIAGEGRGFTLEFGGEIESGGRKLLRILVTRKLTETFSVLLDDETYFIVMRVDQRTSPSGRKLQVVTHFEDFRPVASVLLPHKITVALDGQASQQTRILRIEPNPTLTAEAFNRPKVPPAAPRAP